MLGPKLDSKTYAILILMVIGVVLSVTLVAQTGPSGVTSTADIAAATREVAVATNRVADSNAQIAEALKDLADSVREVKSAMDKENGVEVIGEEKASEEYKSLQQDEALPTGDMTPEETKEEREARDKGVFEMRK